MARRSTPAPGTSHPPSRGRAPGVDEIVAIARRVTDAAGAPVVGGIAVVLHGGGRHTSDIDIYSEDFWATHERLEAAGIMWDAKRREHIAGKVPVHMVGADSLGGPPRRVSTIEGVRVISLADLIRAKLTVGLQEVRRSKDLTHVIDLIAAIPLGKDFAAKLPRRLQAPFKELVDQVHGSGKDGARRRSPVPPSTFRKKYA